MIKQFISEYLTFTKKERVGILILLFLILLVTVSPFVFHFFIKQDKNDYAAFKKEIAALQVKQVDSVGKYASRDFNEDDHQNFYQPSEKKYPTKGELFYFDPNSLDESGWKRLGLRDKTIATIKNFTTKGGRFRVPEDIGKIWGLHEDEVERLLPYVQIQQVASAPKYESKKFEKTTYSPSIVDINQGDTTAFIALPGIGNSLARRIVAFREKLGGFYRIEQVGETFGLPDSTFQKIKPRLVLKTAAIKKLNINTATLEELKAHPYLRYLIGNAIFQYRMQHGKYASVQDIKKIMLVTEEVYNKAVPYLTVTE
ncbi:helix-hairpin-helix domain-containing protein [Ferruginibacter lapsinanis]|uniref:helix-hairpin-helix domain-containing protein n=1 Tax=Ferruginibacter lapsinanis TaxID=563172 RepID=UPI001E30B2ED|nr:helix-hairpin-helix domain-containing protein [Ferruginibacter lapsinanis]UEG50392.1 helix-hairpin-helix domain-containing protein [Ferruginibacter lapsinanis]